MAGDEQPQAQGGWWQLDSVIKYARQERAFWNEQPPLACPRDGEPLRNSPPTDSGSSTELYCTFCDFEYPRDWVRDGAATGPGDW